MSNHAAVTVNRLNIECQLPTGSRDGHRFVARLENIARGTLGDTLEDCLRPLDGSGDEVVVIRSLELELDIDLLLGEREIAGLWADKIKKTLIRVLATTPLSGAVVFANASCYLASAILDIARGCARQRWYYRAFNGLWALPASAALRTAILDDIESGRAALARLSGSELAEICSALGANEASRVFSALFPAPSVSRLDTGAAAAFVAAISPGHRLLWDGGGAGAEQQLLLALLAQGSGCVPREGDVAACAQCFSLLLVLRERYPQRAPALFQSLMEHNAGLLKSELSPGEIAGLAPLIRAKPEVIRALVQPLSPDSEQYSVPAGAPLRLATGFGNALLLLPHIYQLPLENLGDRPGPGKHQAWPLVRWLVLCCCQGGDRFHAAARDPLVRDFCGIAPGMVLPDALAWLDQQCTGGLTASLFAELERDVAPDGMYSVAWLRGDRSVHIRGQSRKGCWTRLEMAALGSGAAVLPLASNSQRQQAMADFDSLWPGGKIPLHDCTRALLIVLAQSVLKSFAWRLPGFANSSVSYLLRNFLGMSASLVVEDGHIDAYLSRVPMAVILNMAGINRGTLYLPDFDGRIIRLLASG